jgi:hypothetical protein
MGLNEALLLPGLLFMDWLVRQFPFFVIRTGFAFSAESFLFWAAVVSVMFWMSLFVLGGLLIRRSTRSRSRMPFSP